MKRDDATHGMASGTEASVSQAAVLRVLLSADAAEQLRDRLPDAAGVKLELVIADDVPCGTDADVAFLSRDVTGESTKHWATPATQAFYDRLAAATSLRWLHVHSSGADRPIFAELRKRGVALTTSSGSNANIVVQTVLGAILSLARRLPQLMNEQVHRNWAQLVTTGLPPDLEGQTAVIVGWGPIGQRLGGLLQALGMNIAVVRQTGAPAGPGIDTVAYGAIDQLLPRADWLVLACPLTEQTRGLVGAAQLALMPRGAHVVNVARGEIMPEQAVISAIYNGRLAGGFLDVFEHEPLPADSPVWGLPNVIVTPHTAGHSAGNNARVADIFLDNLGRYLRGKPLRHLAL